VRLRVEHYDTENGGWHGFLDKWRGTQFQLDDGSGMAWVEPDGMSRHMLGEGTVPNSDQIQTACILLGVSPNMLRGRLRFYLWELRGGQTVTVIGKVAQRPNGLALVKPVKQPFIVTPLLGEAVADVVGVQKKGTRTLALALGIPGMMILCCGLGAAAVTLTRMLLSSMKLDP
jgi:hypothetical protein